MQTPPSLCPACFSSIVPGEPCAWCAGERSDDAEAGDVLAPGQELLGKFRIGRLLGRGGFGATYLAWDTNLEVRIAIKEFLPRQLVTRSKGDSGVRAYTGAIDAFAVGLDQFLGEARVLARFRDFPCIISVLEFFPANGTGYLVMEYLDGQALDQYIAALGRLEVRIALDLLLPVADALRACHAVGLIHRDVSPDNIFVTAETRVKLLDFGAARFAVGAKSANLSVILKQGYAPFEQYQSNGKQGPWTDIYAFTATLYRLITGELPPVAPDRIGGTPLPRLADKQVEASLAFQQLIDKGMALDREQRFQTVDELLAAIEALPDFTGDPVGPTPPVVPTSRWWRPALAGAVGLLLIAGLGYAVAHIPRPGPVEVTTNGTTEGTVRRPATQLSSMRESVRQAAQSELALQLALAQAHEAANAIRSLEAIGAGSASMDASLKLERQIYADAVADRDAAADRYVERIEWLGGHDKGVVDAALRLEQRNAESQGAGNASDRLSAAVRLLGRHLRLQRGGRLRREVVLADSERLVHGAQG